MNTVRFWDQIGVSTVTGTAYTAVTGSPYMPQTTGRIVALRLVVAGDAATSLIERTDVRLKSKSFGGVDCIISGNDTGLRTAPAEAHNVIDYNGLDLPIQAGVGITIEAKNSVTAVTPNTAILALIEA